jgi:hypothetical protein
VCFHKGEPIPFYYQQPAAQAERTLSASLQAEQLRKRNTTESDCGMNSFQQGICEISGKKGAQSLII